MTDSKDSWELFSKTGYIDAYLIYKSAQNTETGNGGYGEYKDERLNYKKL
ncbi:MAG: YqzL family protein [Clostridia bacterium]|nr:YqzL family protein [Clostridia bacterium]